jgi:hypothetical protein
VDRASAFNFDFVKKKSRRWPGLFFVLLRAFLRVVLENVRFFVWCFCGEVVVDSWWMVVD